MTAQPLIYVDLIQVPPRRKFARDRSQPWRWIAKNGENNKIMARSSERYTNRHDCLDAVDQLFGANSNVYLRQTEQGDELLRLAVES